jgi:hypothetical protein
VSVAKEVEWLWTIGKRRQRLLLMREGHGQSAKEMCNALLDYAVKKDERLRQCGEQDRIDDKTVFIIKRS